MRSVLLLALLLVASCGDGDPTRNDNGGMHTGVNTLTVSGAVPANGNGTVVNLVVTGYEQFEMDCPPTNPPNTATSPGIS